MKTFSLGAILSVTTGVLLSDIGEVHELLDHITGDTLFTHQLPRAASECEDHLREQFPQFAEIEVPKFDRPDDYLEWVYDQAHHFGSEHEVRPLQPADHTVIEPLTEMAMNYPHVKVITVDVRSGEDGRDG